MTLEQAFSIDNSINSSINNSKNPAPSFDVISINSKTKSVDIPRIERAVREILIGIGEDPDREGLIDTPNRVARMYEEIFAGLRQDPTEELNCSFSEGYNGVVLVKDIEFYSMCEHHILPIHGKAHVAYLPGKSGKVTGISKLARLVEGFAKRPQLQERLTQQVAQGLYDTLDAEGVIVLVEASHLCMSMRGIKKSDAKTTTIVALGSFKDDQNLQSQFFKMLDSNS
ncbi:MAG: GTP cyclohydrolase I FolE [Candidatus Caenarcaniphilales bacterium]|nr:GTP cyclohydrolase I FolE [Candidatus Caenarcaniphilales bacterium]